MPENKKGKILPGFGNLDFLCEDFIQGLQAENEQTVHTVLWTTTKLEKKESDTYQMYCPLCYGVMDEITNILEIGSHILSVKDGVAQIATEQEQIWSNPILKIFCFGCKRLIENTSDKDKFIELLPESMRTV